MPRTTAEESLDGDVGLVGGAIQTLDIISTYMTEHLANSMESQKNETDASGQLLDWERRRNYVILQFAGEKLQVNCLTSHLKVVVWRWRGDLLLSVLSSRAGQAAGLDDLTCLDQKSQLT